MDKKHRSSFSGNNTRPTHNNSSHFRDRDDRSRSRGDSDAPRRQHNTEGDSRRPFQHSNSRPQFVKPSFSYSKRGGDSDGAYQSDNHRQRDRSYGTTNNNEPFRPRDNERSQRSERSSSVPRRAYSPATPSNFQKSEHSFSDAQPNDDADIPTVNREKPSYQFQIERPHFTAAELKQFKAIHTKQVERIQTSAKYSTYLGKPEQNIAYKPFINAVLNLGGITQYQLYQLHLYTQCLLASQRHKLTLSDFNDGYFNNQVFPPVPDYFPHLNVTALRRPDLIFNQHLADALSIIPTIEAHVPGLHTSTVRTAVAKGNSPPEVPLEIVDVGAGGGVPSIILAIMRPSWKITAVDSVGKKCNFLRHTADRLGLGNFTVISGNVQHYCNKANGVQIMAEPLEPIQQYGNQLAEQNYIASVSMFEAYDICVARGVTQMPTLLPLCMPLVKPGGKFIAMKSLLSSLPPEERAKYLNRTDNQLQSPDKDIDNPQIKAKKEEIEKLYKTMSGEDGGLEVDMTPYIEKAMKELDILVKKNASVVKDKEDKANELEKRQLADRGANFKRAQADAVTKMDNYDQLVEAVLGTPWIAAGKHSNSYAQLSQELEQSLSTLDKYGCGSNAKPVYVQTDLFFQVAPKLHNNGIVPETIAQLNATQKEIDTVLQKYHPHLFDKSIPSPFVNDVLGKAGETAKYLCVIDKVMSTSNKQRNTLSKDVKQTTTTGIPVPRKPKQLSDRDFVRASQHYEFPSPDAAVDENFVPANPKIQLRKQFQQQTNEVNKFIHDNKEIMPAPKPKVNKGKPQWKIDRDSERVK